MKTCLKCKHFIFKLMLNGFDGVCVKKTEYVKFADADTCKDIEQKDTEQNRRKHETEYKKNGIPR